MPEPDGVASAVSSLRSMPRFWNREPPLVQWLDELPRLVAQACTAWALEPDGGARHGSNALAVPVHRGGEQFILRLAPPGDDVAAEARALTFWDGRGTVRQFEVDVPRRITLLERLGDDSLDSVPLDEAATVMGALMRRLAVPAPPDVPGTDEIARRRATEFPGEWDRLGRVVGEEFLHAALAAAAVCGQTEASTAVDGDLHGAQVHRATREPWLVFDPVLLRGDACYDLARLLWTRVDEMDDAATMYRHADRVIAAAGLETERAHAWIVYRAFDYLLWGLAHGLTEDPPRCVRLLGAFARV
ncbi:aminoglycoside phosphotransferase family protein [Occultella aeris]|nr:aminoglycoside phosphotransferase family protein [Occultella aeris]